MPKYKAKEDYLISIPEQEKLDAGNKKKQGITSHQHFYSSLKKYQIKKKEQQHSDYLNKDEKDIADKIEANNNQELYRSHLIASSEGSIRLKDRSRGGSTNNDAPISKSKDGMVLLENENTTVDEDDTKLEYTFTINPIGKFFLNLKPIHDRSLEVIIKKKMNAPDIYDFIFNFPYHERTFTVHTVIESKQLLNKESGLLEKKLYDFINSTRFVDLKHPHLSKKKREYRCICKEIAKKIVNNNKFPEFQLQVEAKIIENIRTKLSALEAYGASNFADSNDDKDTDKNSKIGAFILDTRTRLRLFQDGDRTTFQDYEEKNEQNIVTLKQNRTTDMIWKSIAVSLCTLGVAVLGGLVQLAWTKGNSFLFWNNKTKCGKQAGNVLDMVESCLQSDIPQ